MGKRIAVSGIGNTGTGMATRMDGCGYQVTAYAIQKEQHENLAESGLTASFRESGRHTSLIQSLQREEAK